MIKTQGKYRRYKPNGINNYPRRIFEYRTAEELFNEEFRENHSLKK